MEKLLAVPILGIMALAAIDIERGETITLSQLPVQRDGFRNLLLNSLGTGQVGPGEVRIPVPTEGAIYEVIIAKPGVPRSVLVARKDAD